MASTNKTPNTNLSQFVASDKPAWLTDYNNDMRAIDEAVGAANEAVSAVEMAQEGLGQQVSAQREGMEDLEAQIDTKLANKVNEPDIDNWITIDPPKPATPTTIDIWRAKLIYNKKLRLLDMFFIVRATSDVLNMSTVFYNIASEIGVPATEVNSYAAWAQVGSSETTMSPTSVIKILPNGDIVPQFRGNATGRNIQIHAMISLEGSNWNLV